jgi:hypothetical protein
VLVPFEIDDANLLFVAAADGAGGNPTIALRPPVLTRRVTRFFSGRDLVISSNDDTVMYRRDGVRGRKVLTGISLDG